jgi:hypothetical protein
MISSMNSIELTHVAINCDLELCVHVRSTSRRKTKYAYPKLMLTFMMAQGESRRPFLRALGHMYNTASNAAHNDFN